MSKLAHSKSAFLNPDQNPFLRWVIKTTFYTQFCAGENAKEVKRTISGLKSWGYQGVILAYAKEIVLDDKEKSQEVAAIVSDEFDKDVQDWQEGTLETVRLLGAGDFVALKYGDHS